jgi:hypothetical protein
MEQMDEFDPNVSSGRALQGFHRSDGFAVCINVSGL